VAVSGGADSLALLHALAGLSKSEGITIAAAHLNHRLRADADVDARFVRGVCRSLGIRCHLHTVDVRGIARRRKLSLEMAGREVRYGFLSETARKLRASAIATAHHADDQVETVLLNLLRGTGAQGLAGIPVVAATHGVRVIRPCLELRHEDALSYLRAKGLAWREDSSNQDVAYRRNLIRHRILPFLEREAGPSVRAGILRGASVIQEENLWMNEAAERGLAECFHAGRADTLSAGAVARLPVALQRRILRSWLVRSGLPVPGLTFEAIEKARALCASTRGTRRLSLPGGKVLVREYDLLRVSESASGKPRPWRVKLEVPGSRCVAGMRVKVTRVAGFERPERQRPDRLPAHAFLSRRKLGRATLWLRTWRPGDRLRPLGFGGSRKIQDILTDLKVPGERRADVPVLVSRGEVIWLPGYAVAQGWGVGSDSGPAVRVDLTVRPERG